MTTFLSKDPYLGMYSSGNSDLVAVPVPTYHFYDVTAQPFRPHVDLELEQAHSTLNVLAAPFSPKHFTESAPVQEVVIDIALNTTDESEASNFLPGPIDFTKVYPFDAPVQVWHVKNCTRGRVWKPVQDTTISDVAGFWQICEDTIMDLDLVREYHEFDFFRERVLGVPSGPDITFWENQEYNGGTVTHITEVIFNFRFIGLNKSFSWKQFSEIFVEAALSFVNWDKDKTSYFSKLVGLRLKRDHENSRDKIFPQIRILVVGDKKNAKDRAIIDQVETDVLAELNEFAQEYFKGDVHIDSEIIQFLPNERRTGQKDQWGQAHRLHEWTKRK